MIEPTILAYLAGAAAWALIEQGVAGRAGCASPVGPTVREEQTA